MIISADPFLVLLAADPDQRLLVVFPPHVLDEMAARRFCEGVGR
ncbi:hypothetical protein OG563_03625 [Nocardia vinacea]|uniref:Uncharacterized protein n=1 Tax=Nocardia vinacea TaxID=96468 RepID=A0ABZ1YWB1_9NOCA|nr:hypothetical protein [Nocardia vinacea]